MPQTPKTAPQGKRESDGIGEKLSKKMIAWTRVVGIFTGCLFVASAIADGFIYWQATSANISQSDVREQSRAYVTFVGVNQINQNQAGKVINYTFQVLFHNWGTTRTSQFSGWASVKYFDKDVPNSQNFAMPWDAITLIPSIVGANGDIFGLVALSADEAIKAKNKQGIVVIWGHIDWADIYRPDIVNPISFCLKLVPARSDGDDNIVFSSSIYKPECNSGMAAPHL